MRVTTRLLAIALALVYSVGTTGAHAQTATPTKTDQLVELINKARVNAGLLPLARSPELDAAAQAHSADMVQHNYLDHTGSDGSEPQERADAAGYHVPPQSAWIVVEVISAISADPQGPVNWWLSDSQHARVLLNPRWRELGAGYAQGGDYGNYWTVDVGCRPGVLPMVTFDGDSYTSTEQCGDPNSAAALAAQPTSTPQVTATPQATGTVVATPTLVPSPTTTSVPTPQPRAAQPSLSVQAHGSSASVSWANLAQASATDWIGIYRVGDADSAYIQWEYTSCRQTPGSARASGQCELQMPASGGPFEVRLFSNNGYSQLARSGQIAAASLTTDTDAARTGSVVNVQWSGVQPSSPTDWIGLYRPGDADAAPISWLYVGCASRPLDARPLGACNIAVPSGVAPGTYEFRLFSENGYERIAASAPIRVN